MPCLFRGRQYCFHRIRHEVASLKSAYAEEDKMLLARQELETVVKATDEAANEVMNLSDQIQELAAKIRESLEGGKTENMVAHSASLEEISTNLLMACEFQDLTGQRINMVVNTIRHLEEQIEGLFQSLGINEGTGEGGLDAVADDDKRPDKDLLHGPQDEGKGVSQAEIDAMFD